MAGLLDFNDPQSAGLLAFAANMFNAGGPSRTPVSFGQAVASGLGGMQQAQQQAELLARQKQEQEMQQQMYKMKLEEMQKAIADQQQMKQAMIDYAKQRNQPMQPKDEQFRMDMPLSDYQKSAAPSDLPSFYGKQPAPQQAQTMQQPSSPVHARISELNSMADFMESRGISGDQYRAKAIELQKLLPKYSTDFRVARGADGQLRNFVLADDGTLKDTGTAVADKLHFADNGQQILAVDQYTGVPQIVSRKMQTPDSMATNATTRRGQDMEHERSFAPTWNNEVGAFVGRPTKANPNGVKIDLAGYQKEDKPLTEVQAKAVTFASRMNRANETINKLSADGIDKSSAGKQFMEAIPFIGDGLGNIYNDFLPNKIQQLDQAKRDWINANLRNESGAAIGKDEFASADKQYFAQIGDKPEVILQKALNRKMAEEGMRAQAGRGKSQIDSIVSSVKPPSPPSPSAAPKSVLKGQVMDGYRFKGGNPADPNAWEKL